MVIWSSCVSVRVCSQVHMFLMCICKGLFMFTWSSCISVRVCSCSHVPHVYLRGSVHVFSSCSFFIVIKRGTHFTQSKCNMQNSKMETEAPEVNHLSQNEQFQFLNTFLHT